MYMQILFINLRLNPNITFVELGSTYVDILSSYPGNALLAFSETNPPVNGGFHEKAMRS